MKPYVLKGSKQEIAEAIARIDGGVRETIVFVDDPSDPPVAATEEGFFAEVEPCMVDVPDVDDSREAICRRTEGE